MKRLSLPAMLAVTLTAAGCVEMTASRPTQLATAPVGAGQAPNTSAATWKMPWQLTPASAVSAAQGEDTILAWVPETGYVRGTRTALASLGQPLPRANGPNRAVEACRDVVWSEASKIGAREVEAVSAGPHRRAAGGRYVGPVRMRVTYERQSGYEVRDSMMTCIVDNKGKIVDAYA